MPSVRQVLSRGLFLVVLTVAAAVALSLHKARAAEPRRDLERVDAYVQSLFERSGLPGMALSIVEGDNVVYARGFGTADDAGAAVTPDTLFIIGSTTKSMTALAVLQLADQGKIALDDPVTRFMPGFIASDSRGRASSTTRCN